MSKKHTVENMANILFDLVVIAHIKHSENQKNFNVRQSQFDILLAFVALPLPVAEPMATAKPCQNLMKGS